MQELEGWRLVVAQIAHLSASVKEMLQAMVVVALFLLEVMIVLLPLFVGVRAEKMGRFEVW